MTREEYVEDILLSLGHPIVEVENQELIPKLVDKAFRDIKRFIVETRFVTIPYTTKAIDVSGCNIDTVVQIFRTENPSRVSDFTDIYTISSLNVHSSSSSNLLLSDYLYRTQMNQLKSTMTTDLDFTFDKENQKLYINTFYPRPTKVTLAYIPDFKDVSDVKEMHWISYIQRLALAYSKISLGRIRGKYKLTSALYELDADAMLAEGLEEKDSVMSSLSENSDLVFPID